MTERHLDYVLFAVGIQLNASIVKLIHGTSIAVNVARN